MSLIGPRPDPLDDIPTLSGVIFWKKITKVFYWNIEIS